LKITFLGTGTSQGVPFIGCSCDVCTSQDKRDKRLRASIWIQDESASVVIDSGPDFRYQMLRADVKHLDAIVFTHGHKDHVAGLDDVRAYNYWQNGPVDIYANAQTEAVIRREFSYVFNEVHYPGIPMLHLITMDGSAFDIGSLHFQPVKVLHYKMEVYGFRVGRFTYITDANFINDDEVEKIKGTEILVLNALRHESHISHFTLKEAIAMATRIGAQQTYFTHISHQLGLHVSVEKTLPPGMHLAYDGLLLNIGNGNH
jgi:phosphoribosyl 1,2-cyclic phosphate phosphodiesterase